MFQFQKNWPTLVKKKRIIFSQKMANNLQILPKKQAIFPGIAGSSFPGTGTKYIPGNPFPERTSDKVLNHRSPTEMSSADIHTDTPSNNSSVHEQQ